MLAAGKSSLASRIQSHGRVASSLMIGSVRTLIVPYGAGSRQKFSQKVSAAAIRRHIGGTPKIDITASAMPISPKEFDIVSLVMLGEMGNPQAREEILKRHVMTIDSVSYEMASEKVDEIAAKNRKGRYLLALPYQIGIAASLTAGLASIPLVFHLPTAEWFNLYYVTTDVPETKDLETALEVGAWTWNWMEPPLGQISFLLLCLQFSRAQIGNLGVKPYTGRLLEWRANRLAVAYPQYDERVIKNYSKSSSIYNNDA